MLRVDRVLILGEYRLLHARFYAAGEYLYDESDEDSCHERSLGRYDAREIREER